MLMDPALVEGGMKKERKKQYRMKKRKEEGEENGEETHDSSGNGCVHIILSVLLISSKDFSPCDTLRWCLQPPPLHPRLRINKASTMWHLFFSPLRTGRQTADPKWMKALGKRGSNRESTFLPVLSGGMSRAAVNKCVSCSERKRKREGKRAKQQCGTWHSLVRFCRPQGIRLNEEKTFKCARTLFVDVEIRLISSCRSQQTRDQSNDY